VELSEPGAGQSGVGGQCFINIIPEEETPALTVTDKNNVVDDALERPRPKKDR
jgi:hypothetical protein